MTIPRTPVAMMERLRPVICMGLAALAACGSPPTVDAFNRRILVFTRTEAFRHASIEAGIEALGEMADEAGVGVTATEDPELFTAGELSNFDAVVFLSTTGDVLDADHELALQGFIRAGGGFAGIHSASDTEYDWPWYGELVGAYFAYHPPGTQTATLHVAESTHPATSPLPNPWIRRDEWYDLRDLQPGLSILLNIDETTYKDPADAPEPTPRPIAWYREFDGGRSFYTGLGHTSESFDEPAFRAHIWGGIEWVLGS